MTWESRPACLRDCGHFAHEACFETSFEPVRRCYLCSRTVRKDESLIYLSEMQGEEVEDAGHGDSAKIDALVEILNTIYRSDPRDKVLVFSNFVQFHKLIENRLQSEGIAFGTFYGSHSRAQREATLEAFKRTFPTDAYFPPLPPKGEKVFSPPSRASSVKASGTVLDRLEAADLCPATKQKQQRSDIPRVLLMSIGAGSVGLNLTAANHVIIADPWWQGAIEL